MSSPFFRQRRRNEHTHQKRLDRGTQRQRCVSLSVLRASFESLLARQKGHKEGGGERIGFEEAIHRETGWGGIIPEGTECKL